MDRLTTLVKRLSLPAFFVSGVAYLVLAALTWIYPPARAFLQPDGGLPFVVFMLLSMVILLPERLLPRGDHDIAVQAHFPDGFKHALDGRKHCRSMDIFAHMTTQYFQQFEQAGIEVDHLRVLVRSTKDPSSICFTNAAERANLRSQIQDFTRAWHGLKGEGRIKKSLTIKYYTFDPTHHFMLIDSKVVLMGFYQPQTRFPGTNANNMPTFVPIAHGQSSQALTNSLHATFEGVWRNFSHGQEAEW